MPTQYDQDAYAWALEQAALLRAGKLDQIDNANREALAKWIRWT